ncbi:MAG TPA: InlB B-repeat-containing protein [Acholeplasmataceae bacterium]|nr:InlB B-repeat-containing protein [Acholeplasmataceae bacterium]
MRKFFTLLAIVFAFGLFLAGCDNNKVKVTFDLNYEGAPAGPAAQRIEKGSKASEPIEPTRSGYTFEGWFKDKEGTQDFSFNDPVDKHLTLYAKWMKIEETVYYLAGNFSNYSPNDERFIMTKVDGEENLYTITVELTEEVRDVAYDGHYYKVTDGTWNADGTWGIDFYYIQPAPLSPTGGGLGSIWHWGNGTLTVSFNAETKEIRDTLEMSEDIIEAIPPAIYGEFTTWVYEGENALILTDDDADGVFDGTWEFTEAVTSDATLILSKKWYDDQWGQRWGAHEQYKFDGTPAGMGQTTMISFEPGLYYFAYYSETKLTTYLKLEDGVEITLKTPRIYGAFNGWNYNNDQTQLLTDEDGDGIYTTMVEFTESGSTDISTLVSLRWYDDQWGVRWGANEQYKMDGTPAGMGDSSTFEYQAGLYLFKYNPTTHILEAMPVEADTIDFYPVPRMYGAFNGWDLDGPNAKVFSKIDETTCELTLTFEEAGTSDFTVCLSRKWYDDQWGKRWGAEGQYKFDGTPAGFGQATQIEFEVGTYKFTYNSETHVTTYQKISE